MTIKTYQFKYDVILRRLPGWEQASIGDNYFEKAKNYIREVTNNPSFEFPKYYRVSAIYTPPKLTNLDEVYCWWIAYNRIIDGVVVKPKKSYGVYSSKFEKYIYNNRETPLEYPESHLTDKFGFEEFHAIDVDDTPSVQIYNIKNKTWNNLLYEIKVRCDLTVRFSDDDSLAGDKPGKKIYLVNLNFGYTRSFRKNKNRRKYRNWY